MNRNPFRYLQPVTPQTFVGRSALVNSIVEDLLLDSGDSHAIIAGPRSGKTSLLLAVAAQLCQAALDSDGDYTPFPVYIDLRAATFDSAEAVFAYLLQKIYRQVYSCMQNLGAELGWFKQLVYAAKLTPRDFEEGMLYLLDQLDGAARPVCLILLLDESSKSQDQPWTATLYNQARNLLCNDEFKRRVRLVLTSSPHFLDQSSLYDLPLCGMLKLHCPQVFGPAELDELFVSALGLSLTVQTAIRDQSGGHPFLAQYLLYHVWEEMQGVDLDRVEPLLVEHLVARFLHERGFELEAWVHTFDAPDLAAYQVLSTMADWVTKEQILAAVAVPAQCIQRTLLTLCTQGLAIHDASWTRFHYTGEIFRGLFSPAGTYPSAELPIAAALSGAML